MPRAQTYESPVAKSFLDMLRLFEKPFVHLPLILLIAFAVYSNTFDVPFLFDDDFNIVENPLINDLSNIPSFFTGSKGPFATRPLMHATFALNYHFGGLDTWGYHVVNLAIHLINGILLYFLVLMTGRHLEHDERVVRTTATLASIVFLIHPVQTDAVTYIVSRSMLFAMMFYLLGMILFLRAATAERRKGFWIAGLFVASLLGMGSRENFATFPIMLVLYDLFFVSRFRLREAAGHWKAYLPVFLSLGYLAYIVANNTYAKSVEYPGLGVPSINYFFTQFNVHWTYLRLLALPINQNIDYDYPIAWTLFNFRTILSLGGYLCLWAMAIVLAKRRPVLSFSILWFFVALLPISFGVTLTDLSLDDVIFEHRLYLPGAGVIVAAASGATIFIGRLGGRRLLAAVTAAAVALTMLAGASYKRNTVWESGVSLWADAAAKSPRKARPYHNLGNAYQLKGLFDRAVENYETAIRLYPGFVEAHNNLGSTLGSLGQIDEAIEHFGRAAELDPDFASAHYNLGIAYAYIGQTERAMEHFLNAVKADPYYTEAHINLGIVYTKMGLSEKANEHFRLAEELSHGK